MLFSKKSARRLAMQADAAEANSQRRISRERLTPIIIISSLFFILASIILCYPADPIPYNIGDKPPIDLVSRVDFSIDNVAQIKEDEDNARRQSPPVIKPMDLTLNQLRDQLWNLPDTLRQVPSFDQLPADVHTQWRALTPDNFAALRAMDPSIFNREVESLCSSLQQTPIVDEPTRLKVLSFTSPEVRISAGSATDSSSDAMVPKNRLILVHASDKQSRDQLHAQVALHVPRALVDLIVQYLLDQNDPLFTFDPAKTLAVAERTVAALPHEPEKIKQGTVLAARSPHEITPAEYEKLRLAQSYYDNAIIKEHPWSWALARLGQVLMVLVLTVAGTLYVIYMNPSVITIRRGWALATLLLLTLFLAKGIFVAFKIPPFSVYLFGTAPVLLATIILVVAFNQRFALGISAIHALLVTLALGQSLDFYLTTLTGIGLFVFTLKEIRTRSKLIEVGLADALVLCGSVWALGLTHFVGSIYNPASIPGLNLNLTHISEASLWAACSGIGVASIASAILPSIESIFKITTGSTLLEFCDLNKPLLKRLSAEAQGTFNHSLIVGTLAEAAGNAIGANGLLCRVGAYYHDIGKLSKPQYFIENQSGGPNRHDKLSPAMSLLIIVGHVKDGIELAREYRLPWIIHQFIGQHHGTTLVEYFFHAARQRQARDSESRGNDIAKDIPEISESEFRYPGPKPQTRETAILMICDGVESIVRSMPEPTAGRVETAVHQLVMKRLMDGQFSDCDLTLRDLGEIEQALLRTLAGIYHGRVAYPKPLQLSQPA